MGLTLHYSARLTSPDCLPDVVAEVADICRCNGWKYVLLDYKPDDPDISGIIFNPHPDCESVWLTFDTDGRLINPVFKQMRDEAPDKAHFFAGAFTKTQFAGPQTHIVIVRLLQYIFRKYCTDVRVLDEGNYWDTNDLAVLQERFSAYTDLFNAAFAALQQMPPAPPGESVEDLVRRIAATLRKLDVRKGWDE